MGGCPVVGHWEPISTCVFMAVKVLGGLVHLGEGDKHDHSREHWLGVGGWVFAIYQLLTLGLSFHHSETMMPTSLRGKVHNIPWDDTCVQSVLHPGMISNACGVSCPQGLAHCRVGIYMPPGTGDSSVSHGGVWCVVVGHVIFRHMVLPAFLPGRGAKGDLPFLYLLCEVLQRERSEVLWVDNGSKRELTGAQEMLSLFPCLRG